MCFTFLHFYRACAAQNVSRDSLPYKGLFQPYAAYYGFTGCFIMAFVNGYTVFLPGQWDVPTFIFSYGMIAVCPILFVVWKVLKKTRWRRPEEVDLFMDLDEVEEYARNYVPAKPR